MFKNLHVLLFIALVGCTSTSEVISTGPSSYIVTSESSISMNDGLEKIYEKAKEVFLRKVDSSSVMHNLPTCFADGFEYGLGAEIGISTDKIHARGPVGLEGLTNLKYVVTSRGVIRN